ncbi:MAG: response regulator [Blastocatellia bacterium]|nr:response regulator [Blastocatellia bacterium]
METVLFVDDDVSFLETMERLFQLKGTKTLNVKVAASVGNAVKVLQEGGIDVVVTDIRMPVVDGLQFLRLLHRKHPDMHKVVLTGYGDNSYREACLQAGASLFLEKPKNLEEMDSLYAAIFELLNLEAQEGFKGLIRQASLSDVLQMFCLGGSSVLLEVRSSSGSGNIYIENGEILHVEMDKMKGFEAFYNLMLLTGGEFSVKPYSKPLETTITTSWQYLLMETVRQIDEAKHKESLRAEEPSAQNVATAGLEEIVVYSKQKGVVYSHASEDPEIRADLIEFILLKSLQILECVPSGCFEKLEIEGGMTRATLLISNELTALATSSSESWQSIEKELIEILSTHSLN